MAERKRFLLRIDPAVFDAVERWAGDDLRSVNAQVEYLLADALRRSGRAPKRPRPPAAPEERPPDASNTT
ncbi:MAG: hypothetical protein WD058_05595 [Dehalococcoidia bacterium]